MLSDVYRIDAELGIVYGKRGKPITKKTDGYTQVTSHGVGLGLVHRIIWESVHGPIPAGLTLNHINGIKTDNRISNLEAVTQSENNFHAYRIGLTSAKGERNGRAKLTESEAMEILTSNESPTSLAALYRVAPVTIKGIRAGRSWSHLSHPERK